MLSEIFSFTAVLWVAIALCIGMLWEIHKKVRLLDADLRKFMAETTKKGVEASEKEEAALLHDACLMAKLAYGGSGGGVGYEVS